MIDPWKFIIHIPYINNIIMVYHSQRLIWKMEINSVYNNKLNIFFTTITKLLPQQILTIQLKHLFANLRKIKWLQST